MNNELKKAIIEKIFENKENYQITNFIVKSFKNYIYDENGNCLIGGEEVLDFIVQAIELINN